MLRPLSIAVLLVTLSLAPAWAAEPWSFRPGGLWCDAHGVPINAHGGGILDFGGRYYWFGEHKVEGKIGNSLASEHSS
jgi:hypothetical protein